MQKPILLCLSSILLSYTAWYFHFGGRWQKGGLDDVLIWQSFLGLILISLLLLFLLFKGRPVGLVVIIFTILLGLVWTVNGFLQSGSDLWGEKVGSLIAWPFGIASIFFFWWFVKWEI